MHCILSNSHARILNVLIFYNCTVLIEENVPVLYTQKVRERKGERERRMRELCRAKCKYLLNLKSLYDSYDFSVSLRLYQNK